MHYEGPLLEAWLNRQISDFYRVPPSMAVPPASYAHVSNVFMPHPMHGLHQGCPHVFVPPPMHDATTGGTIPSMQPSFRSTSEDTSFQDCTLSPRGSSEEVIHTTSTPPTSRSECGDHGWL